MLKYIFNFRNSRLPIHGSCKNESECSSPRCLEEESKGLRADKGEREWRRHFQDKIPFLVLTHSSSLSGTIHAHAHTHTPTHTVNLWENKSQPPPYTERLWCSGCPKKDPGNIVRSDLPEMFAHVPCIRPQSGSSLPTSWWRLRLLLPTEWDCRIKGMSLKATETAGRQP